MSLKFTTPMIFNIECTELIKGITNLIPVHIPKHGIGRQNKYVTCYHLDTESFKTPLDDIRIIGESFLNTHKIIYVEEITSSIFNYFNDTIKCINEIEGITFVIKNESAIKTFINDFCTEPLTNFTYNTIVRKCDSSLFTIGVKKVIATVSFVSLSNIFPIYNSNKQDGFVMILKLLDGKKIRLNTIPSSIYTLTAVFSNHKDNVFVVDGIPVIAIDEVTLSTLEHILHILEAISVPIEMPSKSNGVKMPIYDIGNGISEIFQSIREA